jgi:hypothetical protein
MRRDGHHGTRYKLAHRVAIGLAINILEDPANIQDYLEVQEPRPAASEPAPVRRSRPAEPPAAEEAKLLGLRRLPKGYVVVPAGPKLAEEEEAAVEEPAGFSLSAAEKVKRRRSRGPSGAVEVDEQEEGRRKLAAGRPGPAEEQEAGEPCTCAGCVLPPCGR